MAPAQRERRPLTLFCVLFTKVKPHRGPSAALLDSPHQRLHTFLVRFLASIRTLIVSKIIKIFKNSSLVVLHCTFTICTFSVNCVKCGVRSTLCWKIWKIWVAISNGSLKLPKLSIHTPVMLQK